jgi:hypothetical protein
MVKSGAIVPTAGLGVAGIKLTKLSNINKELVKTKIRKQIKSKATRQLAWHPKNLDMGPFSVWLRMLQRFKMLKLPVHQSPIIQPVHSSTANGIKNPSNTVISYPLYDTPVQMRT